MDSFEFFFSFYGLLLGFAVAMVVAGLAGIIALRSRLKISPLPVLLGIFLLQDMATLWVFAWDTREHLVVNYTNIYGAMVIASLYLMAATLAFPFGLDDSADVEAHYWENKRVVFGAIVAGSLLTLLHAVAVEALNPGSAVFWLLQLIYWGPLLALLFTRRRTVDLVLMSALVVGYLAEPMMELAGAG